MVMIRVEVQAPSFQQQLPPDVVILFAMVGDGATGVEGDRVPLIQQVFQDVPVPSQALSQNVNAVALRS